MEKHIESNVNRVKQNMQTLYGKSGNDYAAMTKEVRERLDPDHLEKATPVGTINAYGKMKMPDGSWKHVGKNHQTAQKDKPAPKAAASKDSGESPKSPDAAAAATGIPESEAESVKVDINKRFSAFARYAKTVINGGARSLIAYGTGGVGKTYTVTKQLDAAGKVAFDEDKHQPANIAPNDDDEDEDLEELPAKGKKDKDVKSDNYDYVKITGKMTAPQVYKALYEHNGKTILFDDCDSVLRDANAINLFKGALDTSGDGTIAYGTSAGVKDDDGNKIPKRFKFTGKAIFISNLASSEVPQPIKSRSLRVDLTMTPEQTIDRIRFIAQDKDGKYQNLKFPGVKSYTHKELKEVVDYLDEHKHNTSDLNVRTIGSLLAIKQTADSEGVDWKEDAEHMIFSKAQEPEMQKGVDIYNGGINKLRTRFMDQLYKSQAVRKYNMIAKSSDVQSHEYKEVA